MNCYTNLGTIKNAGTLDLASVTTYDSQLLRIAESSSREIDKYCDRYFYIYEGTLYQDGGANRVVLDWDVQSITSLIVDIDGNNQYPTTSSYTVDINSPTTAPDAFCYPSNTYPKTRLEANPFGSYGHLGAGFRKAIKITGTFGYGNDWPADYKHTAQSTVGNSLTSTASTVSVTASTASEISAGMTLRIGSEQVYVNSTPTASSCPITRAMNGTSAASATTGTAISIYDYPQSIGQACVMQTLKIWKRRESAYASSVGNNITGEYQSFRGLDPDVKEIINQYKRVRIPRYL
jgi:hypothetical protein